MASIEFITARIEKANTAIAKKQNTIVKKQNLIAKKRAEVVKLTKEDEVDENEIYWLGCDISNLEEDIERLTSEIEEKKASVVKYEAQLAGATAVEDIYITKVPEVMKDLEAELVEVWDAFDVQRKKALIAELHEIGYEAFVNKHSWNTYDNLGRTEEQMHTQNVKDARELVLDLYNRVYEVTGEVTDWSNIYCTQGTHGFAVLNGRVNGKEGCAKVESILAGGYNIQRLHVRVLVHAL